MNTTDKTDMFTFLQLLPKIFNIVYTENFHINCDPECTFKQNLDFIKNELARVQKFSSNELNIYPNIKNPKYLFLSLCVNNNKNVGFDIYNNTDNFKWTFQNKKIYNNLNDNFVLTIVNNLLVLVFDEGNKGDNNKNNNNQWEIHEKKLKHINSGYFISCDDNYNIFFSTEKLCAIDFMFDNSGIHFIKPNFRLKFDMNTICLNVNTTKLKIISDKNNLKTKGHNICILLAAGTSSRFNLKNNTKSTMFKQLAIHNGKTVVEHSVLAFINAVDYLVIVSNKECLKQVKQIVKLNKNIIVVENNENCRLKSIEMGLNVIKQNFSNKSHKINNILIHDAARPFLTTDYVNKILIMSEYFSYVQYYLPCVDGIMDTNHNIYDNKQYLKLCTPICANYELFSILFENYIKDTNRIIYEPIPILDILQIKYILLKGNQEVLKKITFADDLKHK